MTIKLTAQLVRKIYPSAPQAVVNAFASEAGQERLAAAGILASAKRAATAFAHCHAETGGFTIPGLTENINYSAERMAAVWPNRFTSPGDVRRKYGSAPGWQKAAIDDIYGGRMGNRPGTHDGSAYIGRGGPQVTGRDGYEQVGRRAGLDLVGKPELACLPENQPAILAAFWSWKGLNDEADAGGVEATVRPWNGGTNGIGERRAQYKRIMEILEPVDDGARPAAEPAPEAGPPVLRRGDKGPDVGTLQTMLRRVSSVGVDGDFGPRTEAAVRYVQSNYGLKVDGVVGPATWAVLEKL